jgi:hypothetical protein
MAANPRTPDEIRRSIEANRAELGLAVERLRGEVAEVADWRKHLRNNQQQVMIGAAVAGFVLWLALDVSLAQLALGVALAAPFAQAIGRLRCLTQGCCHGVPTDARFGIRVWQPQSRVCQLSGLTGQYILMTQLYSILFNLALGALLAAMGWWQKIPVAFVLATYLILTSIERFAEDGYRGETQTRVILGLKEPQWIALGGLAAGILCTLLPSPHASGAGHVVDGWLVAGALLSGLITAFAMSMDFPKSHVRFSRLSG